MKFYDHIGSIQRLVGPCVHFVMGPTLYCQQVCNWLKMWQYIRHAYLSLLQVDNTNEIFEARKDKPPLIKNEPPVAGAIRWAHSLFHRLKHTILPFLEVPEMLESEQIKAVSYFTWLEAGYDHLRQSDEYLNNQVMFTEHQCGLITTSIKLAGQLLMWLWCILFRPRLSMRKWRWRSGSIRWRSMSTGQLRQDATYHCS